MLELTHSSILFFPRVVRSWNKLPISVKKSDSVSELKQELITIFFFW